MKIGKYELDQEQEKIVLDDAKNILVVAGAGSGKTLTILGKIKYLVENKNIKEKEILCISFTKEASNSLKNKIKKDLNLNIEVYTFHKLSLEILDKNYNIADDNLLIDIINNYFLENKKYIDKYLKKYLNKKITNQDIEILTKTLITFIKLFKCNNYQLDDYPKFLKKIKKLTNIFYSKKEKAFLIIALNIYLTYEKYLKDNNEIDFDDMIIKATNKLKNNKKELKYKYLIIDEYQDTSLIRFNLIKEILTKTQANFMAVGDDFQSIYKFTGCSIDLFLNFSKYFKDNKILKIETTYRNSNELIKIAGKFIMKNKNQIRKNLKSNKSLSNPIKIIYYKNIKESIKEVLNKIGVSNEIMILGRNNKDINLILDEDIKLKDNKIIYKDYNIKYLTIHKSKGLESDNVIIINLKNEKLGFPTKIKDNRILRLVNNYEKYPYAEERRLFYVALTRTKNKVYLLVPKKNESIFIKELKRIKKLA